jgi:tRNA-dihydrouridine synthase B
VRKGVGSAMLKNPELLRQVVSAMRARTRGWLSAKIRAGFDDAAGAVATARLIQDSGADLLTVHPRRQVDFYDGVADWRIITRIKRELSIPVIGNGDVWYAADALRMRAETGCDGVMIGRGALRNPWIFEQLDALLKGLPVPRPSGADVLSHFEALLEMFEAHAPGRSLGMLKEQLRYLCRCVPDGVEFTRKAARSTSLEELRAVLNERLRGEPAEALDLGAEGKLERSGSGLAA